MHIEKLGLAAPPNELLAEGYLPFIGRFRVCAEYSSPDLSILFLIDKCWYRMPLMDVASAIVESDLTGHHKCAILEETTGPTGQKRRVR